MRLLVLVLLFSTRVFTQNFSYLPASTFEKTVSLSYYNTEYIFITNLTNQTLNLSFELIQKSVPTGWSATGCTNLICYTKLPANGSFGTIPPNGEFYMSTNLSVNEIVGDATIRYKIFDDANPNLFDTIAFVYHASEPATNTEPQPWAKINYAQNVVTVFLLNESIYTTLDVFDIKGNHMINLALEEISSVSMSTLPSGIYILVVRDENGKELIQKVVKS